MDCKRALEESVSSADKSGDNLENAKKILAKWGVDRAQKKKGREAGDGLVYAYIHHGGKIGALVEVNCETDFVAKTGEFKNLAHEIAMQTASMDPKDVGDLLEQAYIRDPKKTIAQLIDEIIAKVGENVIITRFVRYEIGG